MVNYQNLKLNQLMNSKVHKINRNAFNTTKYRDDLKQN